MSDKIAVSKCQRGLCVVWFVFAMIILILMIVLTNKGAFDPKAQDVWSWFLPNLLPMLLLILSAFAAGAIGPDSKATVQPFVYWGTLGLSVFYLVLLLWSVMSLNNPDMKALDSAKQSMYWLVPVQSLVNIVLGIFFGSQKDAKTPDP